MKLAVLALTMAAGAAGAAGAATQGTMGSSSTGTFTNTFSGNPAQIQILGLQDSIMSPGSSSVATVFGNTPGTNDNFCVVSTGGGGVKLTFTATNTKSSSIAYQARESGGNSVGYWMAVGLTSRGTGSQVFTNLDTTGYSIPAGSAATAASSCGANGNMTKAVILVNATALPTSNLTYIDSVTVVATPI